MPARSDRRTVTNPNLTLSTPSDDIPSKNLGNTVSASATPLLQTQASGHSHSQTPASRRGSPHSLLDGLSATRSVPTTPLGASGLAAHLLQAPGTPLVPEVQNMNGRITTPGLHVNNSPVDANDLQASLSRLPQGAYDHGSLTFNSIQNVAHEDVRRNNFIKTLLLTIVSL